LKARVLNFLVGLECQEENRPFSGQQHLAQFRVNPALVDRQTHRQTDTTENDTTLAVRLVKMTNIKYLVKSAQPRDTHFWFSPMCSVYKLLKVLSMRSKHNKFVFTHFPPSLPSFVYGPWVSSCSEGRCWVFEDKTVASCLNNLPRPCTFKQLRSRVGVWNGLNERWREHYCLLIYSQHRSHHGICARSRLVHNNAPSSHLYTWVFVWLFAHLRRLKPT